MTPRFPHVLLVDACATTRRTLAAVLHSNGYCVREAAGNAAAQREMAHQVPDYVIADWQTAKATEVDLCQFIRAADDTQYVFIVCYADAADSSATIDIMQSGADHGVVKPLVFPELLARLQSGERVLDLDRRLTQDADMDPLTGVMNRRRLLDVLEGLLKRQGPPRFSCVMIDVDHFKSINDRWGHLAGDTVLVQVANTLREAFRGTDYLCRYGGEEFAIIMPGCREADAMRRLEACRAAIENSVGAVAGTAHCPVTASFGVAENRPDDTALEVLERADAALLHSKQQGRNQVTAYGAIRRQRRMLAPAGVVKSI